MLPWLFVALWAGATAYGLLVPASPGSVAAGLPLLALLGFAFSHGAVRLGWRGIGTFFAIAVVVANFYENASINTGFPFGLYHHTEAMGPKILDVPVIVGLLFFAGSYLAWTLAEILLGPARSRLATPLIAAFIVTGWDICGDAIGATVQGNWRYAHGGGYFGVPLTNFLGWYLTTWTIFQAFALTGFKGRRHHDLVPAVFWAVLSLPYPALYLMAPEGTVTDPAGGVWRLADLFETMAIMSIFTMLFVAVLAIVRVTQRQAIGPQTE